MGKRPGERGRGRHEDRSDARFDRERHRVSQARTASKAGERAVHDEDRVVDDDPDQNEKPECRHQVERLRAEKRVDEKESTGTSRGGERNAHQHGKRRDEVLEEGGDEQVADDDRKKQNARKLPLCDFELSGCATQVDLNVRRNRAFRFEAPEHVVSNRVDRIFECEVLGRRHVECDRTPAFQVANHRRPQALLHACKRAKRDSAAARGSRLVRRGGRARPREVRLLGRRRAARHRASAHRWACTRR